ncbi:hypothetical protein E2562_003124 [Oryza meyeriana var. granulata]|uniref:peptidylprolyl isomerase n=1 Tax=Oryza meyeriana var. granulata TaxID=110450 RepID=A0A6G1EA52_9ORYZ|nr:hypothetical protein E2562_003124 [Oryza meyeriana var. granulata]
MVLWGAVVKPGESYVLQLQGGGRHRLLRITKATLGNCDQSGWSMVEYSASDKKKSVMLCALNPKITAMCRLELEFKEDENVVLSVHGQSSIHLSGYYMHPHNDGQRHHRDNPTAQDAEFICLQNQKHHEILESRKCKPLQTEEALCGELIQKQDPDINGQDNVFKKLTGSEDEDHEYDNLPIMVAFENRRAAKNGGAKIHTEKNSHDKEVDIGHEKNGLPHDTSWNTKEVFEKLTGSEDKDHEYDDLPIMVAFEKRRAAKNGAKIQTENYGNKANGEIPANSYLFCEVDLLNVKRARTAKEAPANACWMRPPMSAFVDLSFCTCLQLDYTSTTTGLNAETAVYGYAM